MTRSEWQSRAREFCRRGNELPQAKLTPVAVRMIRANRHGWTAQRWAEHFGVHVRTVNKVQTYDSWRHVA